MSTKIKLCGMTRMQDVQVVNKLKPDYAGFVFWTPSSRYVSPEQAMALKAALDPAIQAVGVFVDAPPRLVAKLLNDHVIDMAQLHGHEDNAYIARLRTMTEKPIIQAFQITSPELLQQAEASPADLILLDSGKGSGQRFDWHVLDGVTRPYLLAGGLDADNVAIAVRQLRPYGVDVSSGIETNKIKDADKMRAFVEHVRAEGERS